VDAEEHADADGERRENQRHTARNLTTDGPAAEQHVARPLAVRVEDAENQQDQQRRIAERQRSYVPDVQPAVRRRVVAERSERAGDRELREEVGAEENFEGRDDALRENVAA
jgi:hypothetical protein